MAFFSMLERAVTLLAGERCSRVVFRSGGETPRRSSQKNAGLSGTAERPALVAELDFRTGIQLGDLPLARAGRCRGVLGGVPFTRQRAPRSGTQRRFGIV